MREQELSYSPPALRSKPDVIFVFQKLSQKSHLRIAYETSFRDSPDPSNSGMKNPCALSGKPFRQTLYRHISPTGELRPDGEKLISR